MGKEKTTLRNLLKKVENNPQSLEAYEDLFDYYISHGMQEEAIETLEKFLEIKKNYPEGECHLGKLYFNKGDYPSAEKRFKRAIQIDSNCKDAYFNLGIIHRLSHSFEEALSAFNQVLKLNPNDIDTLYNIGECCINTGETEKAKFYLDKVLSLDSNHTKAKQALAAVTKTRINQDHSESLNLEIDQNRSTKRKNILVLELPGVSTGNFLDPVIKHLKVKNNVNYLKSTNTDEINSAVTWADIVWLEWANDLAVHVTNNIPGIKDKKVICRLLGYEVFTDMPAKIKWGRVDKLVFLANHKKEIFNQKFNVASPPQMVIRCGINLDKFTIPSAKSNTKRIVLLGYLNFRKGLPLLIQFFHQLLKHDPEYYLYIRGEFQDPRLELAARTMIKELSLIDNLEFVDRVDDINAWFKDKSHILSFSLEESFHYAVGEGMAAGLKPVVHAWTESRDIWPEEFIFNDLDRFLRIMLEKKFQPMRYRNLLTDLRLDLNRQLREVDDLIHRLLDDKSTHLDKSEIYSIKESKNNCKNTDAFIPQNLKSNVFIVGLKRSGTTIFWEMIRQDRRFVCFDEPFHPHLRHYIEKNTDNHKNTFKEFLVRPDLVKNFWSCIQPYEEPIPYLLSHQKTYLRELLKTSSHVCIDFVRCHVKIEELRKIDPDALIIHLVRDPRAFVTSHLKPYGKWLTPELPDIFFEYAGWFDYWQYQTLCSALDYKGKVYEQLLQLYGFLTECAEKQKPDMTIQFEDFVTNPEKVVKTIYEKLNIDYEPLDFSKIHLPNPPFMEENSKWDYAIDKYKINRKSVFKNF